MAEVQSSLFSPLGDVFAQSLIEQRRFDELLAGAKEIPSAKGVPRAVKARIMITAATAAEGLLDLELALALRRFAYRYSKLLNEVEQFSLRVALARLVRKIDRGNLGRHAHVLAACEFILRQMMKRGGFRILSNPVLQLEAVAELSEVLQPVRNWQNRTSKEERHALWNLFRDLSPIFPSAVNSPVRLRELGTILGLKQERVKSERDLDSLVLSYFDNSNSEFHAKALDALRNEVDASFKVVVGN
jgi:hypothetical protein